MESDISTLFDFLTICKTCPVCTSYLKDMQSRRTPTDADELRATYIIRSIVYHQTTINWGHFALVHVTPCTCVIVMFSMDNRCTIPRQGVIDQCGGLDRNGNHN